MERSNNWYEKKRLGGLWRFAIAISALNILGHTVLGFEQAWLHPLVGIAAAYAAELLIETAIAWSSGIRPRYLGRPRVFIEFLLSAHISGLAVSMLLYANERFWVVAFAAAAAIASKAIFRAPIAKATARGLDWQSRHFLNPSNFGITITLLLFPWVGIAPPYHFTENTGGIVDWILPLLIVCSGTFLNWRFTEKLPVIAAWLGFFVLQAVLRNVMGGTPMISGLLPISGLAFVLFTFYMVTDPATTPTGWREQIFFGASVAVLYGVLMQFHVVFGLFFALTAVTGIRGLWLYAVALVEWRRSQAVERVEVVEPATVPIGVSHGGAD